MPIRRTLEHGWLIFADSVWLRRVRSGLSSLLLALLIWPIGIAGIVLYMVSAGGEPDEVIMGLSSMAIGLVFLALWLCGVWIVTSPEPLSNPGRGKPNVGQWIRALHIAAIVMLGVYGIAAVMYGRQDSLNVTLTIITLAAGILCWTAYVLGFLLLLAYMRRLACRHTKPALRKLLAFLLWGGIGFAVLAIIGGSVVAGAAMIASSATGWVAAGAGPAIAPSPTSVPSPAASSTSMPTTVPAVALPARMRSSMLVGIAIAALFYLFVLVWGGGWLLALISFRRTLNQTINENAAAAYNAWLHPTPSPPQAV